MKYIMSLDEGTTGARCIIFNEKTETVSSAQKEFTQYYPREGWVEHDAEEILEAQISTAKQAMSLAGLCASDISAIGITNQRETTVVWDKNTGKPYGRAIVWQCRRTADMCSRLKNDGYGKMIKEKTGLLIDPYFSATKLKWMLDNIPGLREAALRGDALFGTVDSYLIWNLSGGRVHVTDVSNASRTMLFNIHTLGWDSELLDLFGVPESMLPQILPSAGVVCMTDPSFFGAAVPIAGIAGDQQSALFGHGCFSPGECKNTYGTGCFLLMNTGESPLFSDSGLLTTVAWQTPRGVTYAEEGSVFIGGAAVQWLRDEMRLINTASESEYEALRVPDSGGCYVVPAFTGLGAPYWDADARGIITGITRGTNRYHIIRATLESIAYQVDDLLTLMTDARGEKLASLSVDGGGSRNNLLLTFQADISGIRVTRKLCTETTALGAALLAGLGVGIYSSEEEISCVINESRVYTPSMSEERRKILRDGWHRAVRQCRG